MQQLSLGIDLGTSSARALVVDCATGDETAVCVADYQSGVNGVIGSEHDPNLARQNPTNHTKAVTAAVQGALRLLREKMGPDASGWIAGIGVGTTASSPIPVDKAARPLALDPRFENELSAQCWLWKDHTAYEEAAWITAAAEEQELPYLARCGGTYSAEWFWSKIWHCLRTSPDVFEAAHSWVELQDYIPGWLCGESDPIKLKRGICAAGHKAMFSPDWGGLPSIDFLHSLDPRLADLRSRLYDQAYTADQLSGSLSWARAEDLGLRPGIPIAVGSIDAHLGAVGAGIRPATMVKIIGTSSCDLLVADPGTPEIVGVSGMVLGSILPGNVGIEAGQSAVGDIFDWCSSLGEDDLRAHVRLNEQAAKVAPGQSGLLALDWNNGNRNVLADPLLSGLIVGQSLRTTLPHIYRAVIEATAFGARKIIERIVESGVTIDEIVVAGGIAEKSPLAMQIYADVCNRPLRIGGSAQSSALGAAIMGAVAGGVHQSVDAAIRCMASPGDRIVLPEMASVRIYDQLYELYCDLHDAFGATGKHPELEGLMKALIRIRDQAS